MSLERHLVVHLQQMYVTERDYQIYLCDQSGKVTDQQLKTAINSEVNGAKKELDSLKKCLDILGQPLTEDLVSPLVQAIRQEDMTSMENMPHAAPIDVDVHIAMTDISFGSWEIGTYQGMVTMARVLNRQDLIGILEEILHNEDDDLQKMASIMTDLINISRQQKAA